MCKIVSKIIHTTNHEYLTTLEEVKAKKFDGPLKQDLTVLVHGSTRHEYIYIIH